MELDENKPAQPFPRHEYRCPKVVQLELRTCACGGTMFPHATDEGVEWKCQDCTMKGIA